MTRRTPEVRRLLAAAGLALAVTLPAAAVRGADTRGADAPAAAATAEPAAAPAPATTTEPEAAPPADAPATAATPPPADASASSPMSAPADDLTYHREEYQYAATGLRDPFASLVSGKFISDEEKRLPDVGSINLLGVIWGDSDKFAMVEDREGNGFVLRVGDPVVNGEIAGITRDSLTIRQHFFGTSTTVTLKLKPREEKGHARNARR